MLGSGTSMGVPTLGCHCRTCISEDPRDNRMRPSIAIRWGQPAPDASPRNEWARCVVIDTGPDFRSQALRAGIHSIDAVFYTHSHADHILGLDDLRPLSFLYARREKRELPLYADDATATVLERIFDYTFSPQSTYPTRARVGLHRIAGSEQVVIPERVPDGPAGSHGLVEDGGVHAALAPVTLQRIPLLHGRLEIAGYRFGDAAYLTDMSSIPEASLGLLEGLDVLILDALRIEKHPAHANIEQALGWVKRLKPRRAFFTHMSHELHHADTERTLPAHVRLAYDGLEIPIYLPAATLDLADAAGEPGGDDREYDRDGGNGVGDAKLPAAGSKGAE